MEWVFLFCGIYGVGLSLLILSWHLTPSAIRLFVSDNYTLGSHGQVWANWHAIGCLYVGVVNLLAYGGNFNVEASRAVAMATAMIYGIWFAQNLHLVLARPARFKGLMWLNVLLCLLAAVASGAFVFMPAPVF
jgi:hypothetical protein